MMHFQPTASQTSYPDSALRTMFEARKRVFVDLLKWDIPVLEDRYEFDQFDTADAEYLIITDDSGQHRASARLLRTDREHILGQLFPFLCAGPVPQGQKIREITRFCIEPSLTRTERRIARNQLVTALVQHAIRCGISSYTAVAGKTWYRQIAEFGWTCEALGDPCIVGNDTLVALHIMVDAATADDLAANGIYCPASFQVASAGQFQ
jgi:N-acyl-L-homoserine lactone synthetase